jgi:hypothetical protein
VQARAQLIRRARRLSNDAALIRLAGSLLVVPNDEWLVARRYLSQEFLSAVLARDDHAINEIKEVTTLSAA